MSDVSRENFELARQRALALVQKNFGSLSDLSVEVASVVWVTTFRACEIGIKAEFAGGSHGLLKNVLIGDKTLMPKLEEWTIRLQFLNRMVHIIRTQINPALKKADSQILIDCLKWDISDVTEISAVRRVIARLIAKADPLYKQKIPTELFN